MHHIQIQITNPQILECLIQRLLHILRFMRIIPQVTRDEILLSRDTGFLDSVSGFDLVAVYGGVVDVAISCLQSDLDCVLDFEGFGLPGASRSPRKGCGSRC